MSRRAARSHAWRMISATSLTKHYGTITAVYDVTFRCEPGTITGFLGPNGAGNPVSRL